jgi:hypothetical protein
VQTGLLWFDDSPDREVWAKIEDAARRYRERFGIAPDTCYVNDTVLKGSEIRSAPQASHVTSLRLVPASSIRLHHFWIGIDEQREAVSSATGTH